jgi:hypothetical protein
MATPSQTGPTSTVRWRTAPPERPSAPARHRRYRGAVITIQRAVIASAPAEVVFAYLSDFTNAVEWDAGTVSCVLLTGDGAVGSTYANTSKFMGMSTELTYELVERDAPRLVVLRGENATVISTDHILIQSADSGTEVLYTAQFEFKGLARFAEPLLRFPLERLGDSADRSLTRALARL